MISCENRIIYYTFFKQLIDIIHPQKQKRSVQPFCFWGEHPKGLGNQADVELAMINAISAADIAFIMSSSQAIVNWLNTLDQWDFFIVSLMYNNIFYLLCFCSLWASGMKLHFPCMLRTQNTKKKFFLIACISSSVDCFSITKKLHECFPAR